MLFQTKNTLPLGVDLGRKNLKIIELRPKDPLVELENFIIKDLLGKGEERLKRILEEVKKEDKLKTSEVILGVNGQDLMMKKVIFPRIEGEELTEAVKWEVKDWLPIDIKEVVTDYEIIKEKKEKIEVLLAAAKKKSLLTKVEILTEAGFKVRSVAAEPLVLKQLFSFKKQKLSNKWAILNIGAYNTELILFKGEEFIFRRSFKLGGEKFTKEIKDSKGFIYREADSYKLKGEIERKSVADTTANLIREIKCSFKYHKINQVDGILLTGGGSRLTKLSSWLERGLGFEVKRFNLLNKFQFSPQKFNPHNLKKQLPKLVTALALALRGREFS